MSAREVLAVAECRGTNNRYDEPCEREGSCGGCTSSANRVIAALSAAGYKILNEQDLSDGMLASQAASDAWPHSPSGFLRAAFAAAKEQGQ